MGNDPLNRSDPTGQLADEDRNRTLDNATKTADLMGNAATVSEKAADGLARTGDKTLENLGSDAGKAGRVLGPAASVLKTAQRIENGERPITAAAKEGGDFALSEAGGVLGAEVGGLGGSALCGTGCGGAGAFVLGAVGAIWGPDAVKGTVGFASAQYDRAIAALSKTQPAQEAGAWHTNLINNAIQNSRGR